MTKVELSSVVLFSKFSLLALPRNFHLGAALSKSASAGTSLDPARELSEDLTALKNPRVDEESGHVLVDPVQLGLDVLREDLDAVDVSEVGRQLVQLVRVVRCLKER